MGYVSKFSLEYRDLMVKYIKEDFCLNDNASKLETIILHEKYRSLIDSINGFILISNYTLGMYEYISNSIYSNLGYDLQKHSIEEATDFLISIIKEDHRNFMVGKILPSVLDYFKKNATAATGTDFRYTCCLQLRNASGSYFWYLVDTVLIEVDENGFPIRALITCTNIDQVKKDDCLYYNITKKNKDGVYELMFEEMEGNKISEFNLTPREIEIINLISLGNTNKDIAEKLSISLNTAQTHRKNIMKKTKCSGTAELTNFAFVRGLI